MPLGPVPSRSGRGTRGIRDSTGSSIDHGHADALDRVISVWNRFGKGRIGWVAPLESVARTRTTIVPGAIGRHR